MAFNIDVLHFATHPIVVRVKFIKQPQAALELFICLQIF